jgi:hypothetical protein
MRFKGVRPVTLVAMESGANLLTPLTCAEYHSPARGIGHNAGETQASGFLARELCLASAVAQSISGILTFVIGATIADIRWRVKSDFWKTQFSAISICPFQELEQ